MITEEALVELEFRADRWLRKNPDMDGQLAEGVLILIEDMRHLLLLPLNGEVDMATKAGKKCELKKVKNSIQVKFELTRGEAIALKNALSNYPTPVGEDVRDYLFEAEHEANFVIE